MELSEYDVEMLRLILEDGQDGLLVTENSQLHDWLEDFEERLNNA